MKNLIKKYWDIIGGFTTSLLLSLIVNFKLEKIQLIYSIVILMLVSIGLFKIMRQAIEKNKDKAPKKRKENLIDALVDSQRSIKAVSLATEPMREGEQLGNLIIDMMRGVKRKMRKIKVMFDKFKGYILTVALGVLTVMEMCGGFINQMCGGTFAINGIEVLPLITLGAAVTVGCISNGFTKDQREKIKALFAKSNTNELVIAEIKKQLKDNDSKLVQYNKLLKTRETELENLNSEFENAKNTLEAKQQMLTMVPQLATAEDVRLATEVVNDIKVKIDTKNVEINETKETINKLTTTINALKSQL